MIDIIKQNKIILIVLVVIIAAFAWYGLSDKKPSTSLLKNESRSNSSVQEQQIMQFLTDMRSIRLDNSIFKSKAFNSLQDFGRDIVPEPIGRTNPFSPIKDNTTLSEGDKTNGYVFSK